MKTKKTFVENNDENDKRVNDHFTVACVNAFAVDCANNLNAILSEKRTRVRTNRNEDGDDGTEFTVFGEEVRTI